MTTSGSSKARRAAAALFAVATVVLAAVGSGAQALSPPPADKAEIVFSNGGRLVQVDADGSGRKVLTREGKVRMPGVYGEHGDRLPAVSPDGTKVLFTRRAEAGNPDNEFFLAGQNMILDLATGRTREVLSGTKRVSYVNVAWLPGTDRVLASKFVRGRVDRRSVVSVRLDGTGERTIVRFRDYRGGFPKDDLNFEAARLEASPDGSRFLMTRMDIWSEHGYALELVDVETGKRKLVAKRAHSGTWSPGGETIAFVKDHPGLEVCDMDFDCTPSGDLYLADGDGSAVRALTRTRRDEANPTFSPDGSRVAFAGTIVHPRDRVTAEIFSVRTDGSCLVGLTNGSPASLDPSFVPGSGEIQGPGYCGLKDRPALAEGHLNHRMNKGLGKRLWAGPQSSQGLLSFDGDISFLSFAEYGDCAVYAAEDCPPGATVSTYPVCASGGDWAGVVSALVLIGRDRRGVKVVEVGEQQNNQTLVFSGPQVTVVDDAETRKGRSGRRLTGAERMALVDELRPVGGRLRANLPRFLVPKLAFRSARLVTRVVRRRSVAGAMELLDMDRAEVRQWLRFRENAKKLGVGSTTCPNSIKSGFGL